MIGELRQELRRIDEAIGALERLSASGQVKRRGRPPKWLKELEESVRTEPIDPEEEDRLAAGALRSRARTV